MQNLRTRPGRAKASPRRAHTLVNGYRDRSPQTEADLVHLAVLYRFELAPQRVGFEAAVAERPADHSELVRPAAEEPWIGGERVIDRHGLQSQFGHDVRAYLRETRHADRPRL